MMNEMAQDVNNLSTLPKERKAVLIALIGVLFIVSVVVGANLAKRSGQETPSASPVQNQSTPAVEVKNTTDLSLSPAPLTISTGATKQVSVMLSKTAVSAADVFLTYDPTLVEIADIQNGTVFDRVIRKKIDAGSIAFSAAVSPEKKNSLATGTVFTFTVTALKSGTTTIQFDTGKTITALSGANSLGNTTPMTVEIQ